MPHRLSRPRILTVLGDPRRRAEVGETCARIAPQAIVLDAASATDAVLALLSGRVDLMLVDAAWSRDLLPALELHARRSSPLAQLVAFGEPSDATGTPLPRRLGELRPWHDMVPVLTGWLARRAAGNSHPPA